MNDCKSITRRSFLQAGVLGSTALATTVLPSSLNAAVTRPDRDPCRGLKLGLASYTLIKFPLDQAIEMAKTEGIKYISLKDVHLPRKSTAEEREEVRRKLEAAGITLLSGGVIAMKNNEADVRSAFQYAKDAGMPTIVCRPEPAAFDLVEKMAKEYDLRIAIHNHGPDEKDYPSALDVLRLVEGRDAHMGICIDVGHTVRLGQDPVEAIEKCANRLYDFHIKDVTAATSRGRAIAVGRGVVDIVGVLKALLQINYPYHLGLEYEDKPQTPLPGMTESFGYIRGALAAI